MGLGLFSQVTSDGTRENGCRLPQGRVRLDSRKNFPRKGGEALDRLPSEKVASPSLEVSKRPVDVAFGTMALGTWFNDVQAGQH